MKRGEIYYISKASYDEVGSEIQLESGRPGVILSSDSLNEYSPMVTVAFCTTREKKPSFNHIEIKSTKYPSTVLLEQINSIDKKRVGNYIGKCSEEEMKMIDYGIAKSLIPESEERNSYELRKEIDYLKERLLRMRIVNDSLINKIAEIEREKVQDI